MTFSMKKSIILLCTLLFCGSCYSQQRVKVFGIDFSQLTMRQAAFALKPKFTGNVYNSFEAKYPGPDTDSHHIYGSITYAGYENCFAELSGYNGKPTYLTIRIFDYNQAAEIMLKLSNAIREKYGVSPEIKKGQYNYNDYLFRIGDTKIRINYWFCEESRYAHNYGWFDVEVSYSFLPSTKVDSSDL